MRARDPKPEILRLEEIVLGIRRGEIRLPSFQRPFVWTRSDMLDLLDSIYQGYPVGSILLWHSSERLKSEREIVGFEVSNTTVETYPTDYLLDGQQRLTTLCGSLYWDGSDEKSIWRIFFDLELEEFTYAKKTAPIHYFPMNRLMDTSDFLRQCSALQSTNNPKHLINRAEKLLQAFKNYKIAVVRIGDVSLDEVAPIFERINSTGRKLTMVDLMRAATWKQGFNLTQAIEEIASEIGNIGYGELQDTLILRTLAVACGLGINKEDIDKLRNCSAEQLKASSEASKVALCSAMHFLRERSGLDDLSYLPYGLQLAHIAEFFRINPSPTSNQLDELGRWFWATSASRYFAGASTGQNANDLKILIEFANGTRDDLRAATVGTRIDVSQLILDNFSLKNASSTTFCLLLKHLFSNQTIFGNEFDTTILRFKERRNFQDITPTNSHYHNKNIAQIINPFRENYPTKSAFLKDSALLSNNVFDKGMVDAIENLDFDAAIQRRIGMLISEIERLTAGEVTFE